MSKGNGWQLGRDKAGTRFTNNSLDVEQKKLFPELGENEWIEVRLLAPKEVNEIVSLTEKECHEFHPVTIGGQIEVQRVVWSDWVGANAGEKLASQNLASEMRFCATLSGFLLHGEDGKIITVDEENKKRLMANTKFYKIWFRALDVLKKQIEKNEEVLAKN